MVRRRRFRKAAVAASVVSRPSVVSRVRRRIRRSPIVRRVAVSRVRSAISRRVHRVRRRSSSRGMRFMGSNMNDLIMLAGGIIAGWKAPRFSLYQDPAIFMGAGVLGSGVLGSSSSISVLKNVSLGYLLGTVGSSLIGAEVVKATTASSGKLSSVNQPYIAWIEPALPKST